MVAPSVTPIYLPFSPQFVIALCAGAAATAAPATRTEFPSHSNTSCSDRNKLAVPRASSSDPSNVVSSVPVSFAGIYAARLIVMETCAATGNLLCFGKISLGEACANLK